MSLTPRANQHEYLQQYQLHNDALCTINWAQNWTCFVWNYQGVATGCSASFKAKQPVITDPNRSYHLSCKTVLWMARLITCVPSQSPVVGLVCGRPWLCIIDGWLVAKLCVTCSQPLAIWNCRYRFWTWPSTLLWPNFPIRLPMTSTINHKMFQ